MCNCVCVIVYVCVQEYFLGSDQLAVIALIVRSTCTLPLQHFTYVTKRKRHDMQPSATNQICLNSFLDG